MTSYEQLQTGLRQRLHFTGINHAIAVLVLPQAKQRPLGVLAVKHAVLVGVKLYLC